jgi:ferrous iron transport protein B
MRIALIGQPNCGKSTLFNQVAGYKAETGNFHGTTVTFTESKIRVAGEVVELVDLPGTYTLSGTNPAEAVAQEYLASRAVDIIINVMDASHLAQGLELTLELLPLNKPLILALNMMDEASRLGMKINGPALQEKLGVAVLPLIASKGRGIQNLFVTAKNAAHKGDALHPSDSLQPRDAIHRHSLADELARAIVVQGERHLTWRDRIDDLLLHPVWGYFALLAIMAVFFEIVYGLGSALERPVLTLFDQFSVYLTQHIGISTFWAELLNGLLQGISGGVAIVLPYLIPFLVGLGLMEDIGYLPRIAFLMDGLMHRLGLHGKAIVPFILGYGCNVPAVMSTRILEERQDRFIAAALAVLVPCAARLSVVFGLVAFYIGPLWALGIYLFNILIIALSGRILAYLLPEDTPGLILEMPTYRVPTLRAVVNKAWFRIREFTVEAWPLLIFGSIALSILNYFHVSGIFNMVVRPITWALDLPSEVGVPLIFGVLRKELSLVMLRQAVGVTDFSAALTQIQMVTFSVFVVFYIPCLATLSALRRELGWKTMLAIAGFTVVVALIAALLVRGFGFLV